MAQLNHPYAAQVKASQKRRLASVGASAGKSWGRSAMELKSDYPGTNAGTDRPLTISGKTSGKRADRYARGGKVKKKGNVTNVIVAMPPKEAEKQPVPVPVPVGGPPGGPPMGGPPRPPMAPMGGPPPGVPGMRPPGMAAGGVVARADGGPVFKKGGAVKKRPFGGPVGVGPAMPAAMGAGLANRPALPAQAMGVRPFKKGGVKKSSGGLVDPAPKHTYRGFPHSPTTEVDEAVSASKKGGVVKKKGWATGGAVMAGSGTGLSRMRRNAAAAKIPAKTEG